MTTETTKTCKKCGHTSVLVVWQLGHKDTDSVACPKCHEILIEWKKEPISYFVKGSPKS
ncbi:hypothetical protein [Pontibacterium sp.]|uniref:hypothetical protein n=1 Tax=Pontibacterium sp. TaxID=2036026 RepID=UPI003511CEEC